MGKKGQISVFMVVVLILLGSVIFFLNANQEELNPIIEDYDVSSVTIFIDTCLKDSLKDGADFVGIQGGYYDVPPPSTHSGAIVDIPIYIDPSKADTAPNADVIKSELEIAVLNLTKDCMGNFSALSDIGIKIELEGTPSTEATLGDDKISMNLNFPLKIEREGKISRISQFRANINHPLKRLHSIALEMVRLISEDMEIIPVSGIVDIGIEKDVNFVIIDTKDGHVIFSIVENLTDSREIFFNFASEHAISSKSFDRIIIEDIPKLDAAAGYEFEYQILTSENNIVFSDYTDLFDIRPDGLISFTPQVKDKGKHNILIKAEDSGGREDYVYIILEIIHDTTPEIEPIPDQVVTKGTNLIYQVNANDPDNDVILYSIEGIPSLSIHPTAGLINYYADELFEGEVTVTVVDLNSNVVTESFNIKVIE